MNETDSAPRQFFYSVSLLCLPLAFQLAATAPAALPEGLWLILVLSIWASLTTLALLVAGVCRVVWQARRRSARSHGRPGTAARRFVRSAWL